MNLTSIAGRPLTRVIPGFRAVALSGTMLLLAPKIATAPVH